MKKFFVSLFAGLLSLTNVKAGISPTEPDHWPELVWGIFEVEVAEAPDPTPYNQQFRRLSVKAKHGPPRFAFAPVNLKLQKGEKVTIYLEQWFTRWWSELNPDSSLSWRFERGGCITVLSDWKGQPPRLERFPVIQYVAPPLQ